MRKLNALGVLLALSLVSCNNDLDLTAPWKDIPIVYGVLSPIDTAHYIRIEKAFLDPNISALEIARNPDSLYYDNLGVVLINDSQGDELTLERVNGEFEGYPREDGVFATSPNYLYKITADDADFEVGGQYRLEITRGDNLPLVKAETIIIGPPSISRPIPGAKLNFPYNSFFMVKWGEPTGASFYDVFLYIHYDEYNVADPGNVASKTATWKMSGTVTGDEAEVFGIEFFEFMRSALEANQALRRVFKSIDVQVRAGGSELYEFQRVQLANSGITSAGGDIPMYTNLSEGVGVLSSSNRQTRPDLGLGVNSLDSLRNGYITKDLNFQ